MSQLPLQRRAKHRQGISKEPIFARVSDAAYFHLNDEAERRGKSAAVTLDEILLEHKRRRINKLRKSPIA